MKNLLFGLIILFLFAASISAQANEAEKFDEFSNEPCDAYLSRIDGALDKAYKNPSSTVYILIYEGKERRYNERTSKMEMMLPNVGSGAAKINSIKKYIRRRKLSVNRFAFVEAGFRESLTVEMWVVPNGASPPIPTPTLKKMKYRKGKAIGFCTNCC